MKPGAPVADLVQLQLQDFKRRIKGVDMNYAKSKNLTVFDVLTIASMIEREAGVASQRKLVASVIYNRLHEGMPLGIDATIRFATGNYEEPLTESQLAVDSPYNTRTHAGLPPGPINSPGLAAIEAAAHPAKTGYLFYVNEPGTCDEAVLRQDRSRIRERRRKVQLGPRSQRRQRAVHLRGIGMPRLAVIGHPVAHSRSPAMQNAALAALGLGEEWSYEAIDVAPEDFEERLRGMAAEGFLGVNVTVPHKQAALALADVPSEVAQEIGAANTLVFAEGEIQAHNTDGAGLLAALPGPPLDSRTLVLGAGGAARAVVWALVRRGRAGRGLEPHREPSRGARVRELGGRAVASPAQPDYDLIVNTTAVGLDGEDPFEQLPLAPAGFAAGQVVVDMVYGDEPSALLREAEAAARRPSTASRSSSSRAPSRCASGPAASRRSTSCAPPPAPER